MTRTVHWFESVHLVLVLMDEIHVVLVLEEVSAYLPQLLVVHIGSYDFLVAANSVLLAHQSYQPVVDLGAIGIEEGTTWS